MSRRPRRLPPHGAAPGIDAWTQTKLVLKSENTSRGHQYPNQPHVETTSRHITRYTVAKVNESLPPTLFQFTPPPNYREVDRLERAHPRPALAKLHDELNKQDAVLIGINDDESAEKGSQYMQENGYTWPMLHDGTLGAIRAAITQATRAAAPRTPLQSFRTAASSESASRSSAAPHETRPRLRPQLIPRNIGRHIFPHYRSNPPPTAPEQLSPRPLGKPGILPFRQHLPIPPRRSVICYSSQRNIEAASAPRRITLSKPVRQEICNEVADILESTRTEKGLDFVTLVESSPVLLVFLRHAGCTFCRESLSDIARHRADIERSGTRIVLVHMGDRKEMLQLIDRYGLSTVDRICDLDRRLYAAFGLKNGKLWQLFGPKAWWRVLVAGFLRGHGVWFPSESMRQMPGVFFINQGEIARSYRHRSISDRPSYPSLVHSSSNS